MVENTEPELAVRIAHLAARRRIDALGSVATEVHDLRCLADAQGRRPVAAVARALESALAQGHGGTLIGSWMELLQEAMNCGRSDATAHDAFAAACLVRFVP